MFPDGITMTEQEAKDTADVFRLAIVVMPLVQLLKTRRDFSWAHREEIAWAIAETIREHQQLHNEVNRITGKEASQRP